MEQEVTKTLAKKIAELLPEEVLVDVVGKVISDSIRSMTYSADTINKIVHEAVVERARELLKTKFAPEVDRQADLLCAQLVVTLGRMRMPDR